VKVRNWKRARGGTVLKRRISLSLIALPLALLLVAGARAQKEADAPVEMVTYYMGLLLRGPKWTPDVTPEVQNLQKEHLAHMGRLHKAGKLIIAGPFTDNGTIRGIVVYKVETLEEAKALTEADPAVKAGRLMVEMHPWMVQKGILP